MEVASTVSGAHIAARARELLEMSEALLNDSRALQISKDEIDSINHDTHLAFALLARHYNSQVPVNRLHPELLGLVFEHLRAPAKLLDPDEPLEQRVFDSYKPLVNAMMVCHKWHIVASEKALLWTDVTLDWSRGRTASGLACLLERSAAAPIHLRLFVEGSEEDSAYSCEVVHTNAFRLRQLDLCMIDPGPDTMHIVAKLLENDMPLLRCLKMSEEYYQQNVVLRNTSARYTSLRGMMLTCLLWLPAPEAGPLMSLTHLYVSMQGEEIPMSSITALLDATPSLEVLEFHDCSLPAQLPARTTTLEHLTHLTIRHMPTRAAEVFMPALLLPRAATVCLLFDVDMPPTDVLLPQPEHWRDATRIRIDNGTYGSLSVELDGGAHRMALCLEYDADVVWEGHEDVWPLPVPARPFELGNITVAHLCSRGSWNWMATLRKFVERVPALATLVVEEHRGHGVEARGMVQAVRDVLLHGESLCAGLKELALLLPCAADGLTQRLAPALKKRKGDGQQIKRLRIWINYRFADGTDDNGDALAEYVEAGEVEHDGGPFWQRDEEQWRRENEFWEVPKTWL